MFRLLLLNWYWLIPLSILLYLPSWLFVACTAGPDGPNLLPAIGSALIGNVCGALLTASVTIAVFAESMKRQAPGYESPKRSLAVLRRVFPVSLLYALVTLPGSLLLTLEATRESSVLPLAGAVGLLMLLFVQPGVLVMLPAAVVERLSPVVALQRSWSLTRESRRTIFWSVIFLTPVMAAMGALAAVIGGLIAVGFRADIYFFSPMLFATVMAMPAGVVAGVWAMLATAVYRDLRVAKEGIPQEQVAAIFE